MVHEGYGSEVYKKQAVRFVKKLAEKLLADYQEPQRAGKAKGDAIGFSVRKMRAAIFTLLHPRLKIREIAALVGVSEGVLRVWRTQDDFKEQEKKFAAEIGRDFGRLVVGPAVESFLVELNVELNKESDLVMWQTSKTIFVLKTKEGLFNKSKQDPNFEDGVKGKKIVVVDDTPSRWSRRFAGKDTGRLADELWIILWLNQIVVNAFVHFVVGYIEIPGLAAKLLMIDKMSYFWDDYDDSKKRKWLIQPPYMDIWKTLIMSEIDMLADPNFHASEGDEAVQKLASELKEEITQLLDDLAR